MPDSTSTPNPTSTPTPTSQPQAPQGLAGVLHAAGHFFEHLASACRSTVRAIQADAAALVKTAAPQAATTAAQIEAVLADDAAGQVKAELPRAGQAVEKTVEAAAPAVLSAAGQAAAKAVEASL